MLRRYAGMNGYSWNFHRGPGQPDATARERQCNGSCFTRYTNRKSLYNLLEVIDSARTGRRRNSYMDVPPLVIKAEFG